MYHFWDQNGNSLLSQTDFFQEKQLCFLSIYCFPSYEDNVKIKITKENMKFLEWISKKLKLCGKNSIQNSAKIISTKIDSSQKFISSKKIYSI